MKKLFSIFSLLALLVSNVLPAYTYADTGDNSVIEEDNTAPMTQVINNNTEDSEELETDGNNNESEDIGNNGEGDIGDNGEGNKENNSLGTDNNSSNNLFEINNENLVLDNTDMSVSNVDPVINEEEKKAVLLTGNVFIKKIKELANPNANISWTSNDYNIKYIVKSEVDNNNAIIVSDPNKSNVDIKAWFDDGTIYYYYTGVEKIYLNEDSLGLFAFLRALESVDLSDFDTSEVKNMGNFFYNDESLESVDLSNFDTSNLEEMHYFMKGAKKLKTINLSGFVTNKVRHMNDLFEDCTDLETVIIDNWDLGGGTSLTNLGQGIFNSNNSNLKYVSAKNWKNIPSNISFGVEQFFDQNGISGTLDVSNWDTSGVTDMSYTLYNMKNLTTIIGLDTWDTSSVTNMNSVFKGSAFKSLNLSGWDTSIVEDMYAMFEECENLEEIIGLDTRNTSKVKKMGCMFYKCKKLESLNIDNWDLRNLRGNSGNINFSEGGSSMVYNDNSLKSISARNWKVPEDLYNWISYWGIKYVPLETLDVSNWDTSNVTKMNFMFTDITSETTIIGLETWDTSNVDNVRGMFTRSTGLTGLNLSNFDTSKVTQMDYMFSGATNLETIYIGSKFTTGSLESSTKMFDGGINLPNYDENITDIVGLPIYTINGEYSISYELDGGEFQGENIKNKYVIGEIAQLSIPYKTGSEFLGWFEEGSEIPFVLDGSKSGNKTLYAHWKSLEEKAEETTTENVVYTNTTTVTVGDEVTEEVLSGSSTLTLVSKEVEDTEVKKEEDTTKVQDTVIQVTSDKTVEYEGGLEVYLEKTENVGTENETTGKVEGTIKFSAPVAVKIPISSDVEYVKVQVKHGDEDFGFKGLTLNPINECNNGEAVNDKYNGEYVLVTGNTNKYATIYTCSASTFVAYTENNKPVENTTTSSTAAGGGRTITTKQETKTIEQEHNSADIVEPETTQTSSETVKAPAIEEQVKKIEGRSLTRGEVAIMTNILLEVYPQLVEGKQELDDVTNACSNYADEQNFTKDEKKAITRLCKLSIMGIHNDTNEPLEEFLVNSKSTNDEFSKVINRSVATYNEKDLSTIKDALKKLEGDEENVVFGTVYDMFMSIKNILS